MLWLCGSLDLVLHLHLRLRLRLRLRLHLQCILPMRRPLPESVAATHVGTTTAATW
jgi:hypothetical protein